MAVWKRCVRLIAVSIIAGFSTLLVVVSPQADALSDLNSAFKDAYSLAAAQTLSNLRRTTPVLVNRFGEIALYRPGAEEPEVFKMDMALYLETRVVAHAAAALYTRLVPFEIGPLDDERLAWLANYQRLLSAAVDEINARTDIPEPLKMLQVGMLRDVRELAQRIYQQKAVEQEWLDELGEQVLPAVRGNLEAAARSQLEQFRAQVEQWKTDYPDLTWDNSVVVIIGIHQARNRYLQRQFFDWMLHDDPNIEAQVVFAETMTPPPPLSRRPATNAMTLLSKVMLDKGLSNSVFGDPLTLQSDVLADAAGAIIADWGRY